MEIALEMREAVVDFRGRHGTVRAISGMTFQVPRGSVFGFLGPNGAGKTTSMHVLLGFVPLTSGSATILGQDVQRPLARQRIGYMPEHPDTYRFLTGRELLLLTARLFRMAGGRARDRAAQCLEMVGLSAAADRRIAAYSRGMMQRICLAQALINDPDLVILDEPTSGLDPFGRQDVRRIIQDLRARGKTVFFSSHELSEAELVCDTVAICLDGRVIRQGRAAELVAPGQSLERAFLDIVRAARPGGNAA